MVSGSPHLTRNRIDAPATVPWLSEVVGGLHIVAVVY